MDKDNIKCAVLLSNETEMSVRRFSAIPHLRVNFWPYFGQNVYFTTELF